MNEELTGLRDEMRQGFAEMRQEMRQGFARVDERLGALAQDVTELRRDVVGLRQGLATLGRASTRSIDESGPTAFCSRRCATTSVRSPRRTYCSTSASTSIAARADAQRAILALLQTSYRDLDRRLTRLEERAGETGPGARSR